MKNDKKLPQYPIKEIGFVTDKMEKKFKQIIAKRKNQKKEK